MKIEFTDPFSQDEPESFTLIDDYWWISESGNICCYKPGTRYIWAFKAINPFPDDMVN